MIRLTLVTIITTITLADAWAQTDRQPRTGNSGQTPRSLSPIDQASYALGRDIGRGLMANGFKLSPQLVAKGVLDIMSGGKPLMSDKQCENALAWLQRENQKRASNQGEKNKQEGLKFLAANKKKQGVITLPSGLQYVVLKAGNGPRPKATDEVKTHYHGTLLDGTVFDSSVQRGEPISFPVRGVIKGWQEALQLMKVGGKWRLFVPSELAYGERGAPGAIGPNSVLIFEVELLGIEG